MHVEAQGLRYLNGKQLGTLTIQLHGEDQRGSARTFFGGEVYRSEGTIKRLLITAKSSSSGGGLVRGTVCAEVSKNVWIRVEEVYQFRKTLLISSCAPFVEEACD